MRISDWSSDVCSSDLRDPRDAGMQVDRLVQHDPAVAAAKPGPAPVVPTDFNLETELLVELHARRHAPDRLPGHKAADPHARLPFRLMRNRPQDDLSRTRRRPRARREDGIAQD